MDILELIPQRAPIVMVDKFHGIEDGISRTELEIREENIFVENGILQEFGLVEHIAQSAAARAGYIFKTRNEPIPIGYIASLNKFAFNSLPVVGDILTTTVETISEVGGISLVEAETRCGDKTIATGRMKIFLDA